MFPLPIFPEGGLASSVITTVWVGVFVLCFFNLRYGWVLSGLVVPGYLVPLMIVKPLAALVIVVEAILTYAIVWLFSEKLSPGRFPSLFGRDRFMGLILASIAVRLTLDGWILPQAAEWLASNYNQQLDWQSDLRSFGLVIVSLMANQFWKPGLARGLFAMIVTTAISYAIVRYGLMELTNFRMSGVSYLYEGLASSMLASPKAYMILVLTALYASHMNVRYGWDFSGILIPALIALQWYQPTKILTSFAEAALIYVIARQVLKLPFLANVTMEGANKILLFFNISFVLKLIVGHLLVWLAWDVKTTDFYGFGYLLSTLLAMKAHDKDIFPRLMRSTLQVSFVGAALGNLAGLALAALVPATVANAAARSQGGGGALDALLVRAIGDSSLRRATRMDGALTSDRREALLQSIALLEAGLPPLEAGAGAAAGGWRLVRLDNELVAISRADGAGADLILFDGAASNDVAVIVDDASAPSLAFAALDLRARLGARWLLLTSPEPPGSAPGETVLEGFRAARPGIELEVARQSARSGPSLRLSDRSATALDLRTLRAVVPGLAIGFAPDRGDADTGTSVRARLDLPPGAIDALLAEPQPEVSQLPECRSLPPVATARGDPAATLVQRLFLRDQIVRPLLALEDAGSRTPLAPIRRAARLAGLELTRCTSGRRTLVALVGPATAGRYFFDISADAAPDRLVMSANRVDTPGDSADPLPSISLVPAGFAMAGAARAKVLAIAPRELAYDDNQTSMFGAVIQTAIDTMGDAPELVLQLRSRPRLPQNNFDNFAVVTTDRLGDTDGFGLAVVAIVRGAGFEPKLANRDRQTAGFEAFSQTALLYLNHSQNKRYAVVYVPQNGRP